MADPEIPAKRVASEPHLRAQHVFSECFGHLFERNMDRGGDDAERVAGQHHGDGIHAS